MTLFESEVIIIIEKFNEKDNNIWKFKTEKWIPKWIPKIHLLMWI